MDDRITLMRETITKISTAERKITRLKKGLVEAEKEHSDFTAHLNGLNGVQDTAHQEAT